MIDDGEYAAVVDRFEGDRAVLVIEDEGEDVADASVRRTRLPPDARAADAVLTVTVEDGRLTDVAYDPAATRSRAESAQERFDSLARRPPERDEDSDG